MKILTFSHHFIKKGFPGGLDGKESACKAGDLGSVPGQGRSRLPCGQKKKDFHLSAYIAHCSLILSTLSIGPLHY